MWYMWEQKWFYLKGCCFKKVFFSSVPVSGALPSDPEWEHRSGNNSANHPGHPADWRDLHVLFKVSTYPELSMCGCEGLSMSRCSTFGVGADHLQVRLHACGSGWSELEGFILPVCVASDCVSMLMVTIEVPPADGRNFNWHFYEYECAGRVAEPL